MKFDLYLVRHGETTANRDFILQGHSDYPLTDLGVSQAEDVGDVLKDIKFHSIYASDLLRAYRTTNIILSKSTSDFVPAVEQCTWLREINFGVREGLSRTFTAATARIEFAKRNSMRVEDVVDTAESNESVHNRQNEFILQVLKDYMGESSHTNGNSSYCADGGVVRDELIPRNCPVLCVSHGGYIKNFIRTFCKMPSIEKIGNCAVSIVTVEWKDTSRPTEFECTASLDRVNMQWK